MLRTFDVEVTGVVRVTFDDTPRPEGIMPDDEWREQMYGHIHTAEDLARFFAYNYAVNSVDRISRIDGFADRLDSEVQFEEVGQWETEIW